MKAHIGVDAESGLVHTVTTTAANAHDVTQAHALLHGQEEVVFADSGYRGVETAKWHSPKSTRALAGVMQTFPCVDLHHEKV